MFVLFVYFFEQKNVLKSQVHKEEFTYFKIFFSVKIFEIKSTKLFKILKYASKTIGGKPKFKLSL